MRPVRALAAVILCASTWLWWRIPMIRADIARFAAAGAPRNPTVPVAATASLNPRVRAPMQVAIGETASTLIAKVSRPAPWKKSTPGPTRAPIVETHTPKVMTAIAASAPATQTAAISPSSAERAYAELRQRDRRSAALDFRAALAATPRDPRAEAWRAELASLEKRWSGSVYSLVREGGATDLAASPLLGGGQSGAQLAWSIDPLARRPLAIEARASTPNASPSKGAQTAIGLAWQAAPGVSFAAERLLGLGSEARGGWTIRAAGGAATSRLENKSAWLDASVYAEAGAIGVHDTATYAAVQGHIGRGVDAGRELTLAVGLAAWGSVQHDRTTVDRVDIGPSIALRRHGIELSADYRLRVLGNARPKSGPALTVAAYF